MLFIAYCTDDPQKPDLRMQTRPAHVDWLKANDATIKVAGPWMTDDCERPIGSLLILEGENVDAMRAFLATDPYAEAGLFMATALHPWRWVIGAPETA